MQHKPAAIAAYTCIAVMDLQTLAQSAPAPWRDSILDGFNFSSVLFIRGGC